MYEKDNLPIVSIATLYPILVYLCLQRSKYIQSITLVKAYFE